MRRSSGGALVQGDGYLHKKQKGLRGCGRTEERPRENRERRWPSASHRERPQKKPNKPALRPWAPTLQNGGPVTPVAEATPSVAFPATAALAVGR